MNPNVKPLSGGMRWLLLVASGLVFLAGFQLFVLTELTNHYFAWTINPPITAAFLGAGYWASFLLEFLASRQRIWANARISVPAVFTFTTFTLIATLLHLERFHFNSPELFAMAAAWIWLGIYLVVPPAMLGLWIVQIRAKGAEPVRREQFPRVMRMLLILQALAMLVVGCFLFVSPEFVGQFWPWKLTALTGRAVASWLIGVGVFAAHLSWENDFARVRAGMVSYASFGVLQIIALGRFSGELSWNNSGTWPYTVFILTIAIVGLYGTKLSLLTKS